eukprot:4217392-Pyramimonas_sp.AAC.1
MGRGSGAVRTTRRVRHAVQRGHREERADPRDVPPRARLPAGDRGGCGPSPPLLVTLHHSRSLLTTLDQDRPLRSLSTTLGHSRTTLDQYRPLPVTINHSRSLSTTIGHSPPLSATLGHSQPLSTTLGHYMSRRRHAR